MVFECSAACFMCLIRRNAGEALQRLTPMHRLTMQHHLPTWNSWLFLWNSPCNGGTKLKCSKISRCM